jgi:hypothetical protein
VSAEIGVKGTLERAGAEVRTASVRGGRRARARREYIAVIKFCCRSISIGTVGYLTSSLLGAIKSSLLGAISSGLLGPIKSSMLGAISSGLLGAIKSHTCMPPISSRPSAA